jgi:hypothetical protein
LSGYCHRYASVFCSYDLFQTFAGEYRDIVGTALFFEEDPMPPAGDSVFTTIPERQLRYVCKTRKALHMSRVFLRRKDSAEDIDVKYMENDSIMGPDVDTSRNSVSTNQKIAHRNICNSSSDNLSMEVEELHPVANNKKTHETRKDSEPEPVAGPSWMPDLLSDDVTDLGTLMEATASKSATHEILKLVEKQINITSDSIRNIVTGSDSVCDG